MDKKAIEKVAIIAEYLIGNLSCRKNRAQVWD